jgi:penicillin-binding protein-related factor A (putative recombinase)
MSWRTHHPRGSDRQTAYKRGRKLSEAEQKRKQANKEAQRTGADAERLVEEQGLQYLRDGVAVLRKRYEPYKRVGRAGKNNMFKAVPTGASGPDFELWLQDGRAGLIEVKSRKGARVSLSAVGDTQALALRRMSEWGHLAFVLVRLDHEWYLVSYEAWTHEKKRSLNKADLSVQGVRCPMDAQNKPDFLSVLDDALRVGACYASSLPPREDHEGEKSET